jgi:molecular chaperone DnaJ
VKDYYKILEVAEDADPETIKKSYRNLALKYHPDKNKSAEAEDKFKLISEAYGILGDPSKKSSYDLKRKGGMNFDDIFSHFGQRFNTGRDPFNDHYNVWKTTTQNQKGTSLNITLQVNLNEVLNGVDKKIRIKREKKCISCSGSGAEASSFQNCAMCNGSGHISVTQNRGGFIQINSVQVCNACQGSGRVVLEACLDCFGHGLKKDEEVVEIKIPAGASDGMQFIVEGRGNDSKLGGKAGDLFVKIKEISDPTFIRKGIDLITSKEITFIDAVLGTNIDVILPTGESVTTIVDPGTIPGTVLKFAQKGVPNMGYGGKGDFLVELNVKIPSHLTDEEKEWLEEQRNNNIFQ